MNDGYTARLGQWPHAWHEGGLFMGMHWAWWSFALGTLIVLIWTFGSLLPGGATHRKEATREAAEEALRQRFAQGDINEEQFAETLRVLRESR